MTFQPIDPKKKLPELEEEVLKFWKEDKTFEKSIKIREGKENYIFYEGPPTANGKPGIHHAIARAFKDVIPRYKTMKGLRVERKAGWDTHGLPVELQVEKQLGIKSKQEIENIIPGNPKQSIIDFNQKCKESVWEYKDIWNTFTERMGYWVDLDNPYVTYENKYIENVWWVLQQISTLKDESNESIVYKGHKVVPYCYRCGTALSTHELAQGYQTIKDNSVYIKFKVKNQENTYFLVWTTTPWTLPGNVALAVGEKFDYVKIKQNNDFLILIKDRLTVIEGEYEIIEEMTGDKLLGTEYDFLYKIEEAKTKKAYFVISGEFVSTTDGTGIVHIAPAFGIDDAEVGRVNNLPVLQTVSEKGEINVEVPGKGIPLKKKNDKNKYEVDELIIKDLQDRNLFYKTEQYEHEYPFCWRCDTPLIYFSKPSWFIKMSLYTKDLLANNEHINWIPDNIKNGRFGEWLAGVKDWAISRDRYWGTPLPIWQCDQCENVEIIGSKKELEDKSSSKLDDLHKPFIDEVKWSCKCGGSMTRTPEVMDVWFDSGSMPTAQFNYPNSVTEEDKKKIESGEFYPADYISEAIDQTRGWFYTMLAISTLLNKAGKVPSGFPYKNVICLGHIQDKLGKKMSKSKGNVLDPFEIMNQYGADIMRWYMFTINQPGLTKRFDPKGLQDINNRVIRMLLNSYSFFAMYANIDNWVPSNQEFKPNNFLDQWIISELNLLIKEVDEKLDKYDIYLSSKKIEDFIDNLSNWYIRRSRRRFWKSDSDNDKNEAYQTLYLVLTELTKLMAPFTPFLTETIFTSLTENKLGSVHLQNYPVFNQNLVDEKLSLQMSKVRQAVELGLSARAKAAIKVRQPLNSLEIKGANELQENQQLIDLIKDEVNIKNINFVVEINQGDDWQMMEAYGLQVALDKNITPELKLEGLTRDLVRYIQEGRKKAGFNIEDRIIINWQSESDLIKQMFNTHLDYISKETLAEKISEELITNQDWEEEVKLENELLKIQLRKV